MGDGDVNFPKFTPMPSLAHELGVMFGFIAACLFTMGLYFVLWQSELSNMSHLRHCPLALNFLNKSTDPLQCQTAQFHFSESGICMLTGKQRPNAAQPTRTEPVVIPFVREASTTRKAASTKR